MEFYFLKSKQTRHIPKNEIIPHLIPIPEVALKDYLHQAASEILVLLQAPPSTTTES